MLVTTGVRELLATARLPAPLNVSTGPSGSPGSGSGSSSNDIGRSAAAAAAAVANGSRLPRHIDYLSLDAEVGPEATLPCGMNHLWCQHSLH